MGWLRLVGSLKLQVSFAECSLFYRALLQERPMIWRSLLNVATTCCLSHLGWHFRMLFQSSKLKGRTSLLPQFSEKRRSSFEIWAFEELEARHMWMSHVTCEWVMSLVNTSGHIWMSRVTYARVWIIHVKWKRVTPHIKQSRHVWISHVTYEYVVWYENASCQMWMRHVACARIVWQVHQSLQVSFAKEPYKRDDIYLKKLCDKCISHVTYEWVLSHMNESCHQ